MSGITILEGAKQVKTEVIEFVNATVTQDTAGKVKVTSTGGGDVTVVGTPVDNQVTVWVTASSVEGTTGLTYVAATPLLSTDGQFEAEGGNFHVDDVTVAGYTGVWLHKGSYATGNWSLAGNATLTYVNAPTAGEVHLRINSATILKVDGSSATIQQPLTLTGGNTRYSGIYSTYHQRNTGGVGSIGGKFRWDKAGGGWGNGPYVGSYQFGADADQQGITFYVHTSATEADPAVEAMRMTGQPTGGIALISTGGFAWGGGSAIADSDAIMNVASPHVAQDIVVGSTSTSWVTLAKGTSDQYLKMNSGGTLIEWADLGSHSHTDRGNLPTEIVYDDETNTYLGVIQTFTTATAGQDVAVVATTQVATGGTKSRWSGRLVFRGHYWDGALDGTTDIDVYCTPWTDESGKADLVFYPGDAGTAMWWGSAKVLTTASDLLLGTDAATSPHWKAHLDATGRYQVENFGEGGSHVFLHHRLGGGGARFLLEGSPSGTLSAPGTVASGNNLARFEGGGYDGTQWTGYRGGIILRAAQAWSDTNNGMNIDFVVTPNDSDVVYSAWRIEQDGTLLALNGAAGNQHIDITGGGALTLQRGGVNKLGMGSAGIEFHDKLLLGRAAGSAQPIAWRTWRAGEELTQGEVVFLDWDSGDSRPEWFLADADLAAFTAHKQNLIGVQDDGTEAAGAVAEIVTYGYCQVPTGLTDAAAGQPVYVSAATPGALTTTAPTGSGDIVQVVGFVIDTNHIFVCPQYIGKN